jgi:hypothetical protein
LAARAGGLENALADSASAAVFIGPSGISTSATQHHVCAYQGRDSAITAGDCAGRATVATCASTGPGPRNVTVKLPGEA